MIRNPAFLTAFEDQQIRKTKPSYARSFSIFTALWTEAVNMGVLPRKVPLEDLEAALAMARILNSLHV
jgi:hypothetical protein